MGYNGIKQKRPWGPLFDRGVGADNPEEKSRYYHGGLRAIFVSFCVCTAKPSSLLMGLLPA